MAEQKSGSIILTASVDALALCGAGLAAAKGGAVALTRSLVASVAKGRARVNAVCPNFVTAAAQIDGSAG